MNGVLTYVVHGDPAPQGSKRAFRNKHTGTIQQKESSARVEPWRQDVRQAIEDRTPAWWTVLDGPIGMSIAFAFDRPQGHYRTGRNAHLLRDGAPRYPAGRKDDLDKLVRSTIDAVQSTGRIFADDGQVVQLDALKAYT
ncbi:MAG: RusA family crossover junction endodeoxyribonuclease, partial [Gammaproteobacteria bacterium]